MKVPRHLIRSSVAGALFVGTAVGVVASGSHVRANEVAAADASALTIAQSLDPRGLFPSGGSVAQEVNISGQIVEKLIDFPAEGTEFVPVLATSWEQVDDLTLRLTLREDVTFTNDEPFNADSVVASVEVMLAAESYANVVGFIDGATAVDDYTVDVTTAEPTGLTLNALAYASYQYPPEHFADVGPDGFAAEPIGTGPYTLGDWSRGESVSLVANSEYWGGAPAIEHVDFLTIPDPAAQIAAARSGDVDMVVGVPVGSYETIESDDGIDLVTIPSGRVFGLMLSIRSDSPLQDAAVRRALWPAIDTEALVANQLGGRAAVLDGQVAAPMYVGYNDALKATPYDPDLARELLAEAGYPDGFSVRFNYSSGRYAQDREIGQAIADQLTEVGIEVEQNVLEGGAFLTALNANELDDMYLAGYLPPPDAHFLYRILRTDASPSYYSDPALDELIDAEGVAVDPEERQGIFVEMSEFVQQEAPLVPLFQGVDAYAVADHVEGFVPMPSQLILLQNMSVGDR